MYGLQLERTDFCYRHRILLGLEHFHGVGISDIYYYKGLIFPIMGLHNLSHQCGSGGLAVGTCDGRNSAFLHQETKLDLA